MKKITAALIFGIFIFSAASLTANVKLQSAHKKYNGVIKITKCADCHNDKTKIEKKKGQNFKAVLKTASCAGKGCHQ